MKVKKEFQYVVIHLIIFGGAFLVAGCDADSSSTSSKGMGGVNNKPPDYKAWTISALSDSLDLVGTNHFVFMEEASMQGSYLELDIDEVDDRSVETMDALYYIHEGDGAILVNGTSRDIEPGEIIFLKEGTNLKFTEIRTALKIVIVTMTSPSNSSAPEWQSFRKRTIEATRNSSSNVWNPFIQFSNVILGLYMLPKSNGGDSRLVHTWQELNIVTSGDGSFKMDSDEIEVNKGSIFFVEEGNGHFFRNLDNDLDILILWEQP